VPKTYPTRRNFGVRAQLLGKLGEDGFKSLLDTLEATTIARPPKRRRRARKVAS
jgi:hypothetical protein